MLLQFQIVVFVGIFLPEYIPISITPIISKIIEKLIARSLYKFPNAGNIWTQTQFGFRKGLGI